MISLSHPAPPPSPPSLQLQDLKALSVLGRGAKGVVFLVRSSSSSAFFDGFHDLALKAISRSSVEQKSAAKAAAPGNEGSGEDAYRRIWFERDALLALRHPLLPTLRGVVYTDKIVGFVIDRCSGGDLNSLRLRQTEKMFSDDVIRFYAAEMVLALEYLHSLGIVYRDLKPENVLIQEDGHIMIVDFDLSTKLASPESPRPYRPPSPPSVAETNKKIKFKRGRSRLFSGCFTANSGVSPEITTFSPKETESLSMSSTEAPKSNSFVGTEEYVSPEVIEGKGHDFAVDWWSLGIVLYEMLYGRTPFKGQNRKETFYRTLTREPELTGEQTALRDLIRKLLEKDPWRRLACDEIKRHEFFRGVDWESITSVIRPPFIPPPPWAAEREDGGIDVEKTVEEAQLAKQNAAASPAVAEAERNREEGPDDRMTKIGEGGGEPFEVLSFSLDVAADGGYGGGDGFLTDCFAFRVVVSFFGGIVFFSAGRRGE